MRLAKLAKMITLFRLWTFTLDQDSSTDYKKYQYEYELSSSQTTNSIAVATPSSFSTYWTDKNNVPCDFNMQVNASMPDQCLVWGVKGCQDQ
jgi:hypothetical protein